MKEIKFIVGLADWGKTTCIKKYLNIENKIVTKYKGKYRIFEKNNKKFFILQNSNCDLKLENYLGDLKQLLQQLNETNGVNFGIAALCPRSKNEILKIFHLVGKNKFHIKMIYLEYHWDNMAKLQIETICDFLSKNNFEFTKEIVSYSEKCKEYNF
jgi:hypothetical protein